VGQTRLVRLGTAAEARRDKSAITLVPTSRPHGPFVSLLLEFAGRGGNAKMFLRAVFLTVTAVVGAGVLSAETFNLVNFIDPLHPNNTVAKDVNDVGQIVGYYESFQPAFTMGFLYESGTFTTINVANANYTVANGINNAGEIVGYYADGLSKVHGFIYDQGTFVGVDGPNAMGTWVSGINSRGQAVGYYSDVSSVFHGFMYDHGAIITLDDPNAGALGSTRLFGINDPGQVVGEVSSPISGTRGVVYDNGQFRTLSDRSNGTTPIPAAINDTGEIAGTAVLNDVSYGFVNADENFSYFRDPAYTETILCRQTCVTVPIPIEVSGINNAGNIVGFHSYIDVATPVVVSFTGTPVMPTPIPESASALLVAAGLAGILLVHCARRRARSNW